MNFLQLLYGLATFIPGVNSLLSVGSGGSNSARYCYSVWLRHLVLAHKNGLNSKPLTVAELGPGDSLGIGISALLTGSEQYFAFDAVPHTSNEINLKIFDELVVLFKNREPIPDQREFPNVKPLLDDYRFPHEILTDERLETALDSIRLDKIRSSITSVNSASSCIQYKAPWHKDSITIPNSVDMILSQAVLEHVDELKEAYESMFLWLKDDGFMAHQIDFKCHNMTKEWNGHWTLSNFKWKLIRGNRPYSLNRKPLSTHLSLMKDANFKVVYDILARKKSNITRNNLAPEFRSLSDEDLATCGAFVQANKLVNNSITA